MVFENNLAAFFAEPAHTSVRHRQCQARLLSLEIGTAAASMGGVSSAPASRFAVPVARAGESRDLQK